MMWGFNSPYRLQGWMAWQQARKCGSIPYHPVRLTFDSCTELL